MRSLIPRIIMRALAYLLSLGSTKKSDNEVRNMAATFELYVDRAGEHRWRLRHQNGNIIADSSEGYSSKENAINGIESVKENAPAAPIEEQSG